MIKKSRMYFFDNLEENNVIQSFHNAKKLIDVFFNIHKNQKLNINHKYLINKISNERTYYRYWIKYK